MLIYLKVGMSYWGLGFNANFPSENITASVPLLSLKDSANE